METTLWFKMLMFLLVIGTFMSLISAGTLPAAAAFPTFTGNWVVDTVNFVGTMWSFGLTLIAFFTGFGALLGIGGVPVLPSPFSYIMIVVLGFMWVFLAFEVLRTVLKSVLP
jgi:hypothetical protein